MAKAQILIVEDENVIAMELEHRLKHSGYGVVAAVSSGKAAIQKAAEARPDLVLMDIRLKGAMDGIEAAAQIQTHFDIPVIYLTAFAGEETLQRAKVTESFGYLVKPFDDRELYAAIEMALYKHAAERKLRESERWLATTLKSIGEGVLATDTRGCVTFMNPVAEALTGWQQAHAVGQDLTQVFNAIHEETRDPLESLVTKVLQEDVPVGQANHALLIARDGRETSIDHNVAPIKDEGGSITGVVLVFRDITKQVRAEAALRRHSRELTLLNRASQALSATLDLEQVLGTLLEEAHRLLDITACSVWLIDPETDDLSQASPRGPSRALPRDLVCQHATGPQSEIVRGWRLAPGEGLVGWVAQSGESLIVPDAWADTRYFKDIDRHTGLSLRAFLSVPLRVKGKVIGVVNVMDAEVGRFQPADLTLIEPLAAMAAVAIENARLFATEQARVAALARALEQQQELAWLKGEFIQNVSHELRTPLAIARGYAELLDSGELGALQPDQEKAVNAIARRVLALSDMMDDLAAILDAEAGALKREPVDLADLVQNLLHHFQPAAERTGLTLVAEIEPDLPPVSGDAVQLYRVVDNLLDNAFKFTPVGGDVTVRLRQVASGANSPTCQLEVSDTGIGIPHDQLERIFERFYQVDGSTTRRYGGTGLGLALAKEIVEAHGGRVAVQSTPDQGSTFQVTLPALTPLHS